MKIAANRFMRCVFVMPGSVAAGAERRLGIRSGTVETKQRIRSSRAGGVEHGHPSGDSRWKRSGLQCSSTVVGPLTPDWLTWLKKQKNVSPGTQGIPASAFAEALTTARPP